MSDCVRLPPTPYTVVIDTREKHPYAFAHPLGSSDGRRKVFAVQTKVAMLSAGDYSLVGHEHEVAVERKSLADAFGTIGQGRRRFTLELERLSAMKFAAVVVEAEWSEILTAPPPYSRLSPKVVFASVMAWQQRFPSVHWWMVPGRDGGEVTTIRILDRFWRDQHARKLSKDGAL